MYYSWPWLFPFFMKVFVWCTQHNGALVLLRAVAVQTLILREGLQIQHIPVWEMLDLHQKCP